MAKNKTEEQDSKKGAKALTVSAKDKSSKKKSVKKEKKESKIKKAVKETTSELKRLTWPTFKEVCKKTGVVLAVVIVFAGVLLLIDYLLGLLFGLLH